MPGWAKPREKRPLPAYRNRAHWQEWCSRACTCYLRLEDQHDTCGTDATTSGRSHGAGRARKPGGGRRNTSGGSSAGDQECERGARVRAPWVSDANLFAAQLRGVRSSVAETTIESARRRRAAVAARRGAEAPDWLTGDDFALRSGSGRARATRQLRTNGNSAVARRSRFGKLQQKRLPG